MGLVTLIAAVLGVVSLVSLPAAYYNYKESPPVSWFNKLIGAGQNDEQWFSGLFSISSLADYSSYSSENYEVVRLWNWTLKLPLYWDTVATVAIIIWMYGYLLDMWCGDLWNDLMEYPTFRNSVNCLIMFILLSPTTRFLTRLRDDQIVSNEKIDEMETKAKLEQTDMSMPDLETEDERESKCECELSPLETVAAFVDRLTMEEE